MGKRGSADGFEWDSSKSAQNLEKHGLSFEIAREVFEAPWLEREDTRFDYGEPRWIALGRLATGQVVVLVYTWRGDRRRIISMRKANQNERKVYRDATGAG